MKNKIGVGLVTCNKPERLIQSAPLVPDIDEFVIVNDGRPYKSECYPKQAEVIQHEKNMCVGVSKNDALRYLIQKDCDHLFLIEDDVLIKNPQVFEQYIKAAEVSGIWHMNYGLQGPANRQQIKQGPIDVQKRHELDQTGPPNPRATINYDGIDVTFYPNSVGAFSYFLRGIIKQVGYHDEKYANAFEHVDHTYRIAQANLTSPFWWFADLANSYEYLDNIPGCIENSTIAHTPQWLENFQKAMSWFKHKHGYVPQHVPDTTPEQVLKKLETLKENYSRKIYNK